MEFTLTSEEVPSGTKTLKAMARRSSYKFDFRVLAVQVAVVLAIVVLIGAAEGSRAEYAWAPAAAGIIVSALFYAMFEYKRAAFAAGIRAEER